MKLVKHLNENLGDGSFAINILGSNRTACGDLSQAVTMAAANYGQGRRARGHAHSPCILHPRLSPKSPKSRLLFMSPKRRFLPV
jgi:hypothetical protein